MAVSPAIWVAVRPRSCVALIDGERSLEIPARGGVSTQSEQSEAAVHEKGGILGDAARGRAHSSSSPSESAMSSAERRPVERENSSGTYTIGMPADMLGAGDHFALEVRGDSMIEAGILDSDTVIIKKQDSAETGDIIVALIDDEEATLKRLRKRGASIALEAANPAYETRIFGPDRVRIQGKLVSLIRKY